MGDEGRGELESLIPGSREGPQSVWGRLKEWVLLSGKRMSVVVVLLLGVLGVLLVTSIVRPLDLHGLLENTNTVQTLFTSLLSGSILLVSIVVSINSIVLSEEITDIETQRERIDASIRYRTQIEEFIESGVSPARPAEFLRAILKVVNQQSAALARIADDSDSDEFRAEAQTFSKEVTKEAERAGDVLSNATFGSFEVLLAGLDYDYSWQLHIARRFESKYGHALDDEEQEAIDDLVETLKVFATGREYFKSLYYKRELSRLSSRLLYVALPTIVFTSYVLLVLDANLFPQVWSLWEPLGLTPLVVFVGFAYVVALTPYLVLMSYVVRATTVTLRTLAAGPFILKPSSELSEFGREDTIDVSELPPTSDEQATGDEQSDETQVSE